IGILFSTFGSTYGYRREIAQEKGNLGPLMAVTAVSATLGAVLLLVSPVATLDLLVPALIVFALVMVVFQKRFTAMIRTAGERRAARRTASEAAAESGSAAGAHSAASADSAVGAEGAGA